ncbi:MAG TPA: carbon-nitrogen hydrolase family protein [Geminicoccaceae bacterium]
MRLAVYQGPGASGDVPANLATIRRVAARAAAEGAGLVVFPELFTTGYKLGARLRELAEPLSGPSVDAIGAAAAQAGLAILTGFCEREGERLFNSAVLVGRDGSVLTMHRKCHLFGEAELELFTPGDALAVVELERLRVGILICYDVEFPEAVRALALAGAELVAVPTALMAPYDLVARTLVPARAAENQVFVAYANRTGSEGDLAYIGQSCIVGPDGADLARAGRDEESLLIADLDPTAITDARAGYCYLDERRPELYTPPTRTSNPPARRAGTA